MHGVALFIRPAAPSLDPAPTPCAPRRTATKERRQKPEEGTRSLADAEFKRAVNVVQTLHDLWGRDKWNLLDNAEKGQSPARSQPRRQPP